MVIMEFSIVPVGVGESVSPYVARCVELVRKSGLDYELHAMGTLVEGELDELLKILKQCFDELARDCDRISCSVKFDYRKGKSGQIQAKVASVQQKLPG